MNKNINKLYAVILDNKIVAIDTNLKFMHEEFIKHVPQITYTQLYNWFRSKKQFSKTLRDGKEYHFQVIENN